MTADTVGRRVAEYRRRAGFRSTADLAARIGNPRITDAVLRNIETGRKDDLSVSQLVDISHALGVPLVMLLAPMDNPAALIDLPNVSSQIREQTAAAFDVWASGTHLERWKSSAPLSPQAMLLAVRSIVYALASLAVIDSQVDGESWAAGPYRLQISPETIPSVREPMEKLRDEGVAILKRAGYDVSWVDRLEIELP